MECPSPLEPVDDPFPDCFAALGQDAADAKREEAGRWLERLLIAVPLLPRDKLLKRACDYYNDLQVAWARSRVARASRSRQLPIPTRPSSRGSRPAISSMR